MKDSHNRYSDLSILKRLVREYRSYWPSMLAILLLSFLSVPFALLSPLPMKIAVDSYLGSEPLPEFLVSLFPNMQNTKIYVLIFAIVFGLVLTLLSQVLGIGSGLLSTYTSQKMVLDLRTRLFPHVQGLSLSYHTKKGASDSVYRVLIDTSGVPRIFIGGIIPFLTSIVTLIAMLYVVLQLSWQLALIALAIAPILLMISQLSKGRLRRMSGESQEINSATMSLLQEVLSNVRVVKAFGKEEAEKQRLVHIATEGMFVRMRLAFANNQVGFLNSMTVALGTAVVLFVGMLQVNAGVMTLGVLLMVISYLGRLYGPLRTIFGGVSSLQSSFNSAERTLVILDEVPEVQERPHAKALSRAHGSITFDNVTFAYEQDQPVIDGISFEVASGERVGIAGETGAGKTTLVSLLTRLYDPSEGQILLDDLDIREYKLNDLRSQFSIVLQDPVLFSKSVFDNIAYARPTAEKHEIVEAAKMANIHEFVMQLPDGYETDVGDRGMRLSGGERQRISLARAFLKDSSILVLDEPTSSVDMNTEANIMDAVERLMRSRTTFIIAHRLSTLSSCDKVLVVRGGKLVRITTSDADDIMQALGVTSREEVKEILSE